MPSIQFCEKRATNLPASELDEQTRMLRVLWKIAADTVRRIAEIKRTPYSDAVLELAKAATLETPMVPPQLAHVIRCPADIGLTTRPPRVRSERRKLIDILEQQLTENADLISLVVPTTLARELLEALYAAEEGELRPLLSPVRSRRHGLPYTLRKLRLLAILHTTLLRGRGHLKRDAEEEVAKSYGISIDALRSWEKREKKSHPTEIDSLRQVWRERQGGPARFTVAGIIFDGIPPLKECGGDYQRALRAQKSGKGQNGS